jgi:hypothetical protein
LGWGTNPSIHNAPAPILDRIRRFSPLAQYVGAMRMDHSNANVCNNSAISDYVNELQGLTFLLILDENFAILQEIPFRLVAGIAVWDARLLVLDDRLLMSFTGERLSPSMNRPMLTVKPAGSYLAELTFNGALFSVAELQILASGRNAGVVSVNGSVWEMTTVIPPHLYSITTPSRARFHTTRPPLFNPAVWLADVYASSQNQSCFNHNSIHPLFLPELGGFLAISHRKYGGEATTHFDFGSQYRYIFLVLDSTFRILRHSREYSFPSLLGAPHGIQFVMSAVRLDRARVLITYGIDDCASAAAIFGIDFLSHIIKYDTSVTPRD